MFSIFHPLGAHFVIQTFSQALLYGLTSQVQTNAHKDVQGHACSDVHTHRHTRSLYCIITLTAACLTVKKCFMDSVVFTQCHFE